MHVRFCEPAEPAWYEDLLRDHPVPWTYGIDAIPHENGGAYDAILDAHGSVVAADWTLRNVLWQWYQQAQPDPRLWAPRPPVVAEED